MRLIAAWMVGGLLGLACATGQADTVDDALATDPDGDASSDDKPITSPTTDEDAGSSKKPDAKADAKASSPDPDPGPDPDPDPDPVTTSGSKTVNCNSQFTYYTSSTVLKYSWTATGEVTITSMTTTVSNFYGYDLNDLTAYLLPKGSSTYTDSFSSGDILADGVAVTVPVPSSFTASKGDTLRIDTFFDVPLIVDPSASCTVTF